MPFSRGPKSKAKGSSSSSSSSSSGLPFGWNDFSRLLQLESLLDAILLPSLPPSLPSSSSSSSSSSLHDPVKWVEKYLEVLRREGGRQGWSAVGVSPQLAQFARELALAAREEWKGREGGREGGRAGPVAPWNRLFTAMVVDRLSLALGGGGGGWREGGRGGGPPLRWAYYLYSKEEEEEGGTEGGRGVSLREYQEMDLDEGHRRAHEDFFFSLLIMYSLPASH